MSEPVIYNKQDFDNVSSLLKALAGLGVLSLGAGITYGSTKALLKRLFYERRRPVVMQPSKGLHNAYDANRIVVDRDMFPDMKSAAARVQSYRELVKEADWSFNPMKWDLIKAILSAVDKVHGGATTVSNAVSSLGKPETYTDAGSALSQGLRSWFTGTNRHAVDTDDYQRLTDSDSTLTGIKARLAQYPGLRPLWFIPSATATVAAGWAGGNALMNWIDDLLGKTKQRKEYSEQARQIYNESAQYLKDVASGKIKPKMKKESAVTPSKGTMATTGDGTSSFYFNPNFILGLLAAGWLAKQLKGINKGVDDAKAELADRTHMLWAALAAQKERDYNYNGLYIDMDDTLGETAKDRKLNKQTDLMRSSMRPDDSPEQLRYENYAMGKQRAETLR